MDTAALKEQYPLESAIVAKAQPKGQSIRDEVSRKKNAMKMYQREMRRRGA